VYDSEIDGGDVEFGTSGFLYQNNKLMYDKTTYTLWYSLTGEPVVGKLANSGIVLNRHPVTVTSWAEWLKKHPETTVVDIDTGYNRRYLDPTEVGSAYYEYRESPDATFPTFTVDGRIPEKDNVVGIASDNESTAFPVDVIVAERVVNSTVENTDLVLIGHLDTGVAGVFERGDLLFAPGENPHEVSDESGVIWTATDDALISDDDRSLPRIPARELFFFAWAAFFPGTDVYTGK